jgi:hypothetical protein
MGAATTLGELASIWENMGLTYQNDTETEAFKEQMKAKLLGQSNERSNHSRGTPRD